VAYDPVAAAALLEEAGWKDTNRDGIRECHGCLYAEEWTPLIFELYEYPDERLYVAGALISRQLSKVGFYVEYYPESADSQEFDAFLGSHSADDALEAFDPDQSRLFTRAGDVVWESGNVGSYYNERIESLMEAARTAPGCDLGARAELYREIQSILQEDQPYVWLYVRNEMAVAFAPASGFAPTRLIPSEYTRLVVTR
jgi:peptide/nickel transport system substrate-binding protein